MGLVNLFSPFQRRFHLSELLCCIQLQLGPGPCQTGINQKEQQSQNTNQFLLHCLSLSFLYI